MGIIEHSGAVYCEQACEAALTHCRSEIDESSYEESPLSDEGSDCTEQHRLCIRACEDMGRVEAG